MKMAEELTAYSPQGVALEPTGGLEMAAVAALSVAGLAVMRVNAKRVRDVALAHGLLAKTDKLADSPAADQRTRTARQYRTND